MFNSKKNVFMNSNDIVNSQDIKRTIINIDSKFRENGSDTPSNFYYRPAAPLKNIIRLRLVSAEIPNIWYTNSLERKTVAFRVVIPSTGVSYTMTIADGIYSLVSGATNNLLTAIQTQLTSISAAIGGGITLTIEQNAITRTIRIYDAAGSPTIFALDFLTDSFDRTSNWGLGYMLGYRERVLSNASSYVGDAPADINQDQFVFLQVNDYESCQQSSTYVSFFAFAKIIIHANKYEIIFADEASIYTKEYVFSQPTNIPRFHIRLLDMYGNEINMRNTNISFSFEISEITNSIVYKEYLNYGRP